MELEGDQDLFVRRKSTRTVLFRWSVLTVFKGPVGPEKVVLGKKMSTTRRGAPTRGRH